MPFYVEFPADPVTDVHWKSTDDGGGGGGVEWPCGAFMHGYGKYDEATGKTHFGEIPGSSIFLLADFSIYGIGFDETGTPGTGAGTALPYSYWWSNADYMGDTVNARDVPYLWGDPESWSVTLDVVELRARLEKQYPEFLPSGDENPRWPAIVNGWLFQEFRNLNIQAFQLPTPAPPDSPPDSPPLIYPVIVPDRVVEDTTILIPRQNPTEIYPPGFRVYWRGTLGRNPASGEPNPEQDYVSTYPPTLVQAHCKLQTNGGYPPRPPEVDRFYGGTPYTHPAPGKAYWPLRPPPPPPYR